MQKRSSSRKKIQRMETGSFDFGNVLKPEEYNSVLISNTGLAAGTWDFPGLTDLFNECLPKTSNNTKMDNGTIIKGLVIQFLNAPAASLFRTAEALQKFPVPVLLEADRAECSESLSRFMIARTLDDASGYSGGLPELFLKASARAVDNRRRRRMRAGSQARLQQRSPSGADSGLLSHGV